MAKVKSFKSENLTRRFWIVNICTLFITFAAFGNVFNENWFGYNLYLLVFYGLMSFSWVENQQWRFSLTNNSIIWVLK